ncbi:DUF2958 domain-containing protein [Sphingomonas sp. CFBP 13728]|uniref:DUF2958 domain-containing protein n=1 Tax=Sphingomonas sp. CFBP 13728 TaxID=2775294 RepID=UPI0017812B02|nr:DUF2958 domain-containing protein [Sphingomonas sp. CFBP 13728]MBD8619730.1 DUF2958 domain-containing protein [Sphingomonas sp. CFBP 13728]
MSQPFDFVNVIDAVSLQQLVNNHVQQQPLKGTKGEQDFHPVCKIFLPWTNGTWLLTEMDPDDGLAFGLADLGMGSPELGYISLDEIYEITGPAGLKMEQDAHFKATKPLSQYASDARANGKIRA